MARPDGAAGALPALHIVFEADLTDYANAVVLRELNETQQRYFWRIKLFQMACAIGLLDEVIWPVSRLD